MWKWVGVVCGALIWGLFPVCAAVGGMPEGDVVNVTPQFQVLTPGQTPDDIDAVANGVNAASFQELRTEDIHLGYTKEPHWFRFEVGPTQQDLSLELSNPQLLSVTLFRPLEDGTYHSQSVGVTEPFWTRPIVSLNPTFPLELHAAGPTTFYLRVQHYGALRFRANVGPADTLRERAIRWIALNIVLAGALLGLAIYHLCIFAGLRQEVYLWLFLLLMALTLNQMTFSGTANMLIWTEPSTWANHALTFTGVLCLGIGMCFSMCFLRAWKYAPGLARVASAVITGGTLFGLLSLAGYPAVLYGVLAFVMIAPCLVVAIALQSSRRGGVPIGLFLISWGMVMLGEIMFASVYLELVPDNVFTMNFMHAAALAASVLWSFTLTKQIRLRSARQRALLEQQVMARTAELEKALNEVKTLEGLLPVCSSCKNIRDESGAWHAVETYVSQRTDADFSHSICPDCVTRLYPDFQPRKAPS